MKHKLYKSLKIIFGVFVVDSWFESFEEIKVGTN